MQGDLISKKTVLDFIKQEIKQDRPDDFKIRNIERFIKDLPTAYDVEKVVAELEEYIEYDAFDYHKEDPLINMSFEKLEDIICNGGKE